MLKAKLPLLGALCCVLGGILAIPASAQPKSFPCSDCPTVSDCYADCSTVTNQQGYVSCLQSCENSVQSCETECSE